MPSISFVPATLSTTDACTGTRKARRRSRFSMAVAALRQPLACSTRIGLFRAKCAPAPKTLRTFDSSLIKATITRPFPRAGWVAFRSTRAAASGWSKSTITSSNFCAASRPAAISGSLERSTGTPKPARIRLRASEALSSLETSSA